MCILRCALVSKSTAYCYYPCVQAAVACMWMALLPIYTTTYYYPCTQPAAAANPFYSPCAQPLKIALFIALYYCPCPHPVLMYKM